MPPVTRRKKAAVTAKLPPSTTSKFRPSTEHPPTPFCDDEASKNPQPRRGRRLMKSEVSEAAYKKRMEANKMMEDTILVDHPASKGLSKDVEQEEVDLQLQLQQEIRKDGDKGAAIALRMKGLEENTGGQDVIGSVAVQKQVNEAERLRRYVDYLEDKRRNHLISSEQMEEMMIEARKSIGIPPGKPNSGYESSIAAVHVMQYNAYLADLERRGLIASTQTRQLKDEGLKAPCAKAAAREGAFEERRRSSAETAVRKQLLQEYLDDLVARHFVTRQQTRYMKVTGVAPHNGNRVSAGLETPISIKTNTSTEMPHIARRQQEYTNRPKTIPTPQILPNAAQTIPDRLNPCQAAAAASLTKVMPEQWTEEQKSNHEIYDEIERLRILQFESFVEELSARGCISPDQVASLKRFRGFRMRKASQEGVFACPKGPNATTEVHFQEFLYELRTAAMLTPTQGRDLETTGWDGFWKKPNIRESMSIGQALHSVRLKRQEMIELLDYRVYENFLTHLKTRGILSVAQMERLKSHGFMPFARHASWQGCFKGVVKEINPYTEKIYEQLLANYAQRGLIDNALLAKLKAIGLRRLEMESSSFTKASTLAPVLASRVDDLQQSTRAKLAERVPNSYSLPSSAVPTQRGPLLDLRKSNPPRLSRPEQSKPQSSLSDRSTHIQPDFRISQHYKQTTAQNPGQVSNTGNGKDTAENIVKTHHRQPSGAMHMPNQQHDHSGRGQETSFQRHLEVEEKRRAENAEKINIDLIQQKAQAQQDMMKNWSEREREAAAYKEKRRQEKGLAKLESQKQKGRDIVSSAIDSVIAEMTNKPLASFMDEDEDEDEDGPLPILPPAQAPKSAAKTNAFSIMMQAPNRQARRREAPIDFSHYLPNFEKSLEMTDCLAVGEKDWAKIVAKNITACVQADIIKFVHEFCDVQTRINAMNALLEIATAVAYTPGAVAERVRAGNAPNYLTASMFIIANKFSETEAKRMMKDKWFVETLKQLRTDPVVPWDGDTWDGLDDVLRVLNDSGPVDFRRVFKTVKDTLQEGSKSASLPIIKAIRREVSDYVTHDSCFETKYNALNVLADIAIGLLQKALESPRRDANLVIEALGEALLKITQMLKVHEIEQIVEELRMDEGIPDVRFCNILDKLLIPDTTLPLYTQQFVYSGKQRTLVEGLLKERSSKKTSDYCETSLLMKLYYINWLTVLPDEDWASCKGKLRIVLGTLVDTSSPIEAGEYLEKLNKNFAHELTGGSHYDGYGTLRESVDRTIHQISKRASSKASYESRINAFKVLTKIGLQLVGWLDPAKPYWQTTIFKDEVTEDSLTDAMRMVCHSLVKDDRAKLLSDEELMKDLTELNTRRLRLPEAMLGLDLTMDLINGMDDDSKRTAKAGTKRKVADYDDLTLDSDDKKQPPLKKHAVARAPKKVVMMIDLTDD